MAFGSKKKQAKNAPAVRDADLISELCDIVDCNEDELKQVVEDLCSFESDGGEFIDGIAKMLDCDEDSIYDEIKRIKELAENPSQGTEEDEEVASARQVIDELLTLFDCTEEDLLSRVQSTQKVANEYYSVLIAMCEMLDCTLDTVSERVEELITNPSTVEVPEVDEEELNSLRESVNKLQSLLEQETQEKEKYKTAYAELKESSASKSAEKEVVSALKVKLSQSSKEIAQLNEQLSKAREIVKSTKEIRTQLREENENLKQANERLEAERDRLNTELRDTDYNATTVKELTEKNYELEQSLASKTEELESKDRLLDDAYAKNKELEKRVNDTSAISTLQELNCELKQENDDLLREVDELKETLDSANKAKTDLEERNKELLAKLKEKDEKLQKARGDFAELTATVSGYEDKISRISELETELEVYKEKEDQYIKMIDEITAAVDKQEELNGKSILNRLCKKFDCEKEALEGVIEIAVEGKMPEEDSFKGLSIELVKLRSENRVLLKKHGLESQIIESLRNLFNGAEVPQLFDLVVSAKDKADASAELSEKVSTYKADIDELQSKVRESYDEVKQLKDENDKLSKLEGTHDSLLRENDKIKKQCSELESLLRDAKSGKTSAEESKKSLISEVDDLKQLLHISEDKVSNLEKEKAVLALKLETAEKDLLDAKVESKKASDRCTELRKSLVDTKKALEQNDSDEVTEYREKVKSLEESLIVEQGRNLQLTTAVEELTDSKDKLLERIRSKDDMIESLKKEVRVQELAVKRLEQRLEGTDEE